MPSVPPGTSTSFASCIMSCTWLAKSVISTIEPIDVTSPASDLIAMNAALSVSGCA